MKKKILRSALTTTLLTALLFTLLSCILLLGFFQNQIVRELEQDVKQLAIALNRDDDPVQQLQTLVDGGLTGRLTLIGKDGTVLYDSVSNPAYMDNHLTRDEIQQAKEEGYGLSSRYSFTLSSLTYYSAVRLDSGAYLRMSETRSSIFSMLNSLMTYLIPALVVICLIASAVAILLTQQIVAPINAINLDAPERSSIYPELRPLLGRMAAQNRSIQEYIGALAAKSNEFKTITSGMSEGLILMNTGGEILMMNSSACRIFGTDDAEGKSILKISREGAFTRAFTAALQGRHSEEILQRGGRFYRLLVSPVYDSGHFSGLFALIPDITDHYLAEQTRREFTANVSHELKTPLTSIAGYAEIMAGGIAPKEDWQGLIECIHRESTRMIRLVEDILHLSRLDSGALYGDCEEIDLPALAREIVLRFESAAEKKGVSITVTGENAAITASRRMTDEILSNLIDNAVKYNREGGSVLVELGTDRNMAVFSVQDSGIGISQEDQQRIFERFFRVDKSRSKATGGTGLGLSIVKHAVQRMGGSIHIDSAPDAGTKITVSLPRTPTAQ